MKLVISQADVDLLVEHARREAPAEACGYLAGPRVDGDEPRAVAKVYPMANIEEPARREIRYRMEPKEQFEAMKDMRVHGWDVVGTYHSHPESQAHPSGIDIDLAFDPVALYVIVSLAEASNPDIRAYSIVDGRVEEAHVSIEG